MEDYDIACKKIWKGYKTYASGASVIRKGFESYGVSARSNDSLNLSSTFLRRGESILEHQAKTAWLASAFASNFPDYFGIDFNTGVAPPVLSLVITALCHDVGETEIGDIPDDGSSLHDEKDSVEYIIFRDFIKSYSRADQAKLTNLFKSFQNKNSDPGRALYALDKTEAVLNLLILESVGIKGNLSAKEKPTGRDLFFAGITNSSLATDIWGCQIVTRLKDYPSKTAKPVLALLKVASCDVRGEEFSWL